MSPRQLSTDKYRYSKTEKALFNLLLPVGQRVDSKTLAKKHYGRRIPINGQVAVVGAVRGLAAKAVRNREWFRVKSTKRRGPYPIEFWVEEK
jgi:hypothetical protein